MIDSRLAEGFVTGSVKLALGLLLAKLSLPQCIYCLSRNRQSVEWPAFTNWPASTATCKEAKQRSNSTTKMDRMIRNGIIRNGTTTC